MSKQEAIELAVRKAVEALREVDWPKRLPALGLPAPDPDGTFAFRAFGRPVAMDVRDLAPKDGETGKPVKDADRVLILHYLACALPVNRTGEFSSFREFPGGQFYEGPFRSRTTNILIQRFGNDTKSLRANLVRFDHEPRDLGDVSAVIRPLGNLGLLLVYHAGDEEFGPAGDVLFETDTLRACDTEDAAVLAQRICLGLL